MNASMKKTVAGTLAALTLAFAVFAAAPASAGPWPHHHHWGWGPFAAAGVIGLAAGAAIASHDYDCTQYRPVYDRWGNYIGDRPVNVCY